MSSLLSKTSWQNTKQLFAYRGKQNNKCCYSLKIWVSDLWNICRYIVEKKNENWANIYIYIIEYRATHFHITEERMLLDQQKLLAINLLLLALDGHVSCSNNWFSTPIDAWSWFSRNFFLASDTVIWRSSLDSEEILWMGNTIMMHFMVFAAFESRILSNS